MTLEVCNVGMDWQADARKSGENAYRALEGVWHYWSRALGVVYVETPDQACQEA